MLISSCLGVAPAYVDLKTVSRTLDQGVEAPHVFDRYICTSNEGDFPDNLIYVGAVLRIFL